MENIKEQFQDWLRETYYDGFGSITPSERETGTGLEFPLEGTLQFAEDIWYGSLQDEYPHEIDDQSAIEVLIDYNE